MLLALAKNAKGGAEAKEKKMACLVCYEDGAIATGCGCRGDGARAHVACLARCAREARVAERWWRCATCTQQYTCEMRLGLAEHWHALVAGEKEGSRLRREAESNLASALIKAHRGREAERMLRRLHETEARLLGAEHPTVLTTAHNLAAALTVQRRFVAAEKIEREVLRAMREVLGGDDLETMSSAHNLCVVLAHQGRYAEAESAQREVLAAQERVLGKEHETTMVSAGNLAYVLTMQGKHAEAETMGRDVLATKRRVLGPEHPDTLTCTHNLACVVSMLGRHKEACTMLRATLEAQLRVIGLEHPHTQACASQLRETLELLAGAGACVCGKLATRSCARCFCAKYCSRECQLGAWPAHRAACDELKRYARRGPSGERPPKATVG
jgi:hypothetical protein